MKRWLWLLMPTVLLLSVLLPLTAASFPSNLLGDLDADGELTTLDARVILRYTVGGGSFTSEKRACADCNSDGRVDTLDVRYVLKATVFDIPLSTHTTTTTTRPTTTTTDPMIDDDGYYDEIVKP